MTRSARSLLLAAALAVAPQPVARAAEGEVSPAAAPQPAAADPSPAVASTPAVESGAPAEIGPAPPQPPKFLIERLSAGGSFGYYSADSLRFIGTIHFDFPFFVAKHKGLYVRGSLTSSISRIEGALSSKSLSLHVEDIDYNFEGGARDYLSPRIAVAAFAGQQGTENLDLDGSEWVRYLGLGAQTASFPRPGGEKRLDWNLDVGHVFESQGLGTDPDWIVRGDVLWDAVRFTNSSLGADLHFDSLVTSDGWRTDWRLGPRWSFDLANGIRASLFAQRIHSRNPLGIGVSGTYVGLNYSEGAYRGPKTGRLPDVRGTLAAGTGQDRVPGSFRIQTCFPPFTIGGRTASTFIDVSTSTLVGRGKTATDDFSYDFRPGIELELPKSLVAGASFEHRSYHLLAEQPEAIQELNFLLVGLHSAGWEFAEREAQILAPLPARWPGTLQWIVRGGYLLSSTQETQGSWLGRGGVRWDLPGPREGTFPFVLADFERGAVSRTTAGIGMTLPIDMTVSVEYRRDSELRSTDKSEMMLIFSLYF